MANKQNAVNIEITANANNALNEFKKLQTGVVDSTKAVESQISGLNKVFSDFKTPVVAVMGLIGGGALFKDAIKDTVDFSKEVNKLSNTLGITKNQATSLQIAIGDIYGNVDDFLAIQGKFVKSINTNEDAINNLGIKTRDQNGNLKNQLVLFMETTQALTQYKGGIDKNAVAMDIFGKSFADVLKYQKLSIDKYIEAREKVAELNIALGPEAQNSIANYRAVLNDIDDTFLALKNQVVTAVLPAIVSLAEVFRDVLAPVVKGVATGLNALISAFSYTSVQIGAAILLLQTPIVNLAGFVGNLGTAFVQLGSRLMGVQGPMGAMATSIAGFFNPVTLTIGAVAGLAIGLEYYSRSSLRAAESHQKMANELINSIDQIQTYSKDLEMMKQVIESSTASDKQKEKALDASRTSLLALSSAYPELFKNFDIEKASIDDLIKKHKEIEAIKKKALDAEIVSAKLAIENFKRQQVDIALTTVKLNALAGAWGNNLGGMYAWAKGSSHASETMKTLMKTLEDLQTKKASLDKAEATGEGKTKPKSYDSETNLQKLKEALEKEKVAYERAAMDKGRYAEYTKDMELKFLSDNLSAYKLSEKEKSKVRVEMLKLEQEIFKQKSDVQIGAYEKEIQAAKNNVLKQMELEKARAEYVKARYGENSKQYQDELLKLQELEKKHIDELKKIDDLRDEQKKSSASSSLDIEATLVKARRDFGLISGLEELEQLRSINEKKLDLEREYLQKKLEVADLEPVQRQEINNKIAALDDQRKKMVIDNQIAIAQELQKTDGYAGFEAGVKQYLTQAQGHYENFKQASSSALQGVESAFSSAIAGIMQGNLSLSKAFQQIWKGILTTVIQTVAKIAAQYLVAGIAANLFGQSTTTAASAQAAANLTLAASESFAAYAGIPYIGYGLAVAQIAAINAFMVGQMAVSKGMMAANKIPAAAEGAYFDRPTLAMVGEGRSPELVVPEHQFINWTKGLIGDVSSVYASIIKRQTELNSYNRSVATMPNRSSLQSQQISMPLNIDLSNTTLIGTDQEEMKMRIENIVHGALQSYQSRYN